MKLTRNENGESRVLIWQFARRALAIFFGGILLAKC
jgi:hypothetical protein